MDRWTKGQTNGRKKHHIELHVHKETKILYWFPDTQGIAVCIIKVNKTTSFHWLIFDRRFSVTIMAHLKMSRPTKFDE